MHDLMTSMFAQAPGAEVALGDFLLRMLLAWLAGQVVGWFYAWSHGVLSYSETFVQSQVLLAMVVCVIMAVIGDSLARAFGLGTALAIVRFRTPIKDARDTVFLFLAVGVGMSAGAGLIKITTLGTGLMGMVAMFLKWSAFGTRSGEDGVLRLHFLGEDKDREVIATTLRRHCRSFQIAATRPSRDGGPEEMVYDVSLRRAPKADVLVRDLIAIAGVTGVSLLPQARVGES